MRINISLDDELTKKVDVYCEKNSYGRSELIAELLRHRIMGVDITPIQTSTLPVENNTNVYKPTEFYPYTHEASNLPAEKTEKIYDELWEDWNLMPVKKERLPEGFCTVFHTKGEKRTLYNIRKIRADGTVELSGDYCKECIKGFVTDCKSTGGHLE